ncbi:group II intron maturase-specific domain-containing protein [Succinatimonas hippei]
MWIIFTLLVTLKGWVGYYRMGIANCSMNDIDKWICRRIRKSI